MREQEERLRVECLTVSSPNSGKILDCVSFEARRGEIVLVAGPSGAGKTTLLRALAGIAGVYGLVVEGEAVFGDKSLRENGGRLTAYVPQEPWYALASPYVAVEFAQLGVGLKEAERLLEAIGVSGKLFSHVLSLSAGEAERVSLTVSLLSDKSIILVDEVSSYLDRENRVKAVEALKSIASRGRIVVVVDHDLDLWRRVASKVLYLDRGRGRIYGSVEETPIYKEARRILASLRGLKRGKARRDTVLRAENLWYRYPDSDWVLRGVRLEAREGDIILIKGRSGAGKSTLLKLLSGLYKPSKGSVRAKLSRQYVPENSALYFSEPTVGEELEKDSKLASYIGLEASKPIGVLSSGEKKRLAIASAYKRVRSRGVLLVDEPTVGLDPWNAVKVAQLLVGIASRGSAVVIASHMEELEYIATRVLRL